MAFFTNINCSLFFNSGMNNWFMPVMPRFNFVFPNFFPTLRLPQYNFPTLTNLWAGWQPRLPVLPKYNYTMSIFQYRMPTLTLSPPTYTSYSRNYHIPEKYTPPKETPSVSRSSSRETRSETRTATVSSSGKIDNSYTRLSKTQADRKAKTDTNLERLSGGKGWSVANTESDNTFITDIPYAKKGTGKILDEVSGMLGEKLVITSALGTGQKGNPHARGGYKSHHNAENPKLDIRTNGNAESFARRLRSTGYFSHVLAEGDHVDVQIDPAKYRQFSTIA